MRMLLLKLQVPTLNFGLNQLMMQLGMERDDDRLAFRLGLGNLHYALEKTNDIGKKPPSVHDVAVETSQHWDMGLGLGFIGVNHIQFGL